MRHIEADKENCNIVNKFGYKRFEYEWGTEELKLLAVPVSSTQRKVVLVRDMWDMTKRHGFDTRISDLEDIITERALARFFVAKNFKYSSLGKRTLTDYMDSDDEEPLESSDEEVDRDPFEEVERFRAL